VSPASPPACVVHRKTKDILMIGSLMMRVSVVILVIGMLWGIEMGIRQDFAMAPAHAHFNLVGGVLLFLFGLYYRLVPQAGASALATVQGWLHIVGAIVFPIGVAIVISKGESMIAVPIIGSLVVVMAVVLFAAIVFRTTRA
jgi:peptidoglycan/LPS O-acetylase OafA/YrhL